MVIIQDKSKRKPSGGRYKSKLFSNRKCNIGRLPSLTKLDEKKKMTIRARGGIVKQRLLNVNKVNLFDPKSKKYSIETIKNIVDCPANKNFIRRNIMTKGTVIETTKGKALVTSRPGQQGAINAVLL